MMMSARADTDANPMMAKASSDITNLFIWGIVLYSLVLLLRVGYVKHYPSCESLRMDEKSHELSPTQSKACQWIFKVISTHD